MRNRSVLLFLAALVCAHTAAAAVKVSTLTLSPSSVFGSTSSTGTVTLTNPAGHNGATVTLTNTNTSYVSIPASITIPSGQTSGTFTANTSFLISDQTATLTASFGGSSASAVLTVTGPRVVSLTLNPTSMSAVTGTSTGTITLDHAIQGVPASIAVASNNAAATVPSSVPINAGQTQANFTVTSNQQVGSTTTAAISATMNTTVTANLTITPYAEPQVTSLVLLQPTITANGGTSTGIVSCDHTTAIARTITLASDNPAATVPPSVTLAVGQSQASFTVTSNQQVASTTTANISATLNATASATLTINPCTSSRAPLGPAGGATDTMWIDDNYPAGMTATGATWDGGQSSVGTQSLTSGFSTSYHAMTLSGATATITPQSSENIFVDVLITNCAVPTEIELGWHTASGWHRAYYGGAQIGNESGALSLGAIPSQRGSWIRVSIASTTLGVAGSAIDGFSLELPNGQVWVDRIGKTCIYSAIPPPPSMPATDLTWIDDAIPAGGTITVGGFSAAQHASGTQSIALGPSTGYSQFYFSGGSPAMTIGVDRNIVLYALINPCVVPQRIRVSMLSTDYMGYLSAVWGTGVQSGDIDMGPVPAAGSWVRLVIPPPANIIGKEINNLGIEISNGQAWFDAIGITAPSCVAFATPPSSFPSGDWIWVDDGTAFPWWDKSQHATGTSSLTFQAAAPGQHIVAAAGSEAMPGFSGDKLIFYMLLDECEPPTEVQFRWQFWTTHAVTGGYFGTPHGWGEGTNVTYLGPLPPAGVWTRVEIPASSIFADNQPINSIYIYTWDGVAWFDTIGKNGCMTNASAPSIAPGDTVWINDSLPSGASLYDGFWTSLQKAEGISSLTSGWNYALNHTTVTNLNQPIASGQKLVFYALNDVCAPATEIQFVLTRDDGSTIMAYWGAANGFEPPGSVNMGSLAAAGTWARYEVPASLLALEGRTVTRIDLNSGNGHVYFDHIGTNP
ncbi:MAG TPA: hypothetical protein VI670_03275 [Thermoanaerobaculia bacterium]